MANLLSVKPILTLRDGTLDLLERVRTRANAWRRVLELVVQAAGQKPVEQMAILHVNALAEAGQFEGQLRASLSCPDTIMMAELTPGLSIYGGTGLVGVALVAALIVAALVYAYAGKGAGQNNTLSELPASPADAGQPSLPLVQPSRTPAARPSPAVDAPAGSRPSGFDFLVLALSWSPEYCAWNGGDDPQQCSLGKKMGFVLHGLWPQYNKGYPSGCSTVHLTEAVKSQYRGLYPSDKLFDHEWGKHGTCSGLAPAQYLALTQKLKNSILIPDPYRAPEKPLRVTPAESRKEFVRANPGLLEPFLAVNCSSTGRYLQELYVCFSLESKFAVCSAEIQKDAAKSCQSHDFLMRNVR